MSLLKRYVLKEFLKVYALTLLGLIGIFLIIDAFERMDEFVIGHGTYVDFFMYFLYKIPFIFFYMAPQSVLLASVVSLATLSRHNEFIAMKSCGISVTAITLPIISASLILSLGITAINEFVTPVTSQRMLYLLNAKVRGVPDRAKMAQDNLWYRSANGAIWNVNYFDPVASTMRGITIVNYDPDRPIVRRRIDAAEAAWDGKQWVFHDGVLRWFKAEGVDHAESFQKQVFPFLEKPGDFLKIQKRPEEMSARDMYRTILDYESQGIDTTRIWVDLNQKLSYPFISIVLALVGIPVALRSSRRGGLLFCVFTSLILGFGFSFCYALGISLGHGGTLSPVLSAWGPNALFIGIGLYLLLTVDSEKLLPI